MGPGLLPLLVLGGLVYGVYRIVKNRKSRSETPHDEWRGIPQGLNPDLPSREPAAAGPAHRDIVWREGSPTAPSAVRRSISADGWAIETHGLTKRFAENVAVNGLEPLVPRGCAFGYLGPNGAGKTTLIRLLLGLTRADAGTMSLLGYPVPRHRVRHWRGRSHRRRAAIPWPLDRAAESPDPRRRSAPNPPLATVSGRRSIESVSFNARTTACRSTRWVCVSASALRPA